MAEDQAKERDRSAPLDSASSQVHEARAGARQWRLSAERPRRALESQTSELQASGGQRPVPGDRPLPAALLGGGPPSRTLLVASQGPEPPPRWTTGARR